MGQPNSKETPPAMDYAEHERTYEGFLVLAKWGTIACAVILIGMYIFLV
jgi:hypothetical protein